MTPKEKAQELFDKYWLLNTDFDGLIKYELAKQCALIAVDEILNLETINAVNFNGIYNTSISYWQEVKKEIENL